MSNEPIVTGRRPRRWGLWLLVAFITTLSSGSISAWWLGGKLLEPANRQLSAPVDGPSFESVFVPNKSGAGVASWVSVADNSRGVVILIHPIRASRLAMVERAQLFHDAGYSTLLIDLQAHGGTPGDRITLGHLERHDVTAAVDYVHSRFHNQRVAIVGWSLGGAAALLAAPLNIDALVLESVYPDIRQALSNRLAMRIGPLRHVAAPALLLQLRPRIGISASELRPINSIASISCPLLVLSGTEDRHTTIVESRRLFDRAGEPKQMCEFIGAAHEDLYRFDRSLYRETVMSFVDQWISRQ